MSAICWSSGVALTCNFLFQLTTSLISSVFDCQVLNLRICNEKIDTSHVMSPSSSFPAALALLCSLMTVVQTTPLSYHSNGQLLFLFFLFLYYDPYCAGFIRLNLDLTRFEKNRPTWKINLKFWESSWNNLVENEPKFQNLDGFWAHLT